MTLEEMKDNRAKWVAALRSDEYKQAQGTLRNKVGHMCCLGVLADIAGCKWKRNLADSAASYAPHRAMLFVGLRTNRGEFFDDTYENALSELNDTGLSFAQIADIIESEPEGLFIDEVA